MNSTPPTACAVASLPADRERTLRFARRVGRFASVQVLVQLIGFAIGILLVRVLEQREYALFTIANTMQGTTNVLADIGISIGLVSIGGRVWQDDHCFGQLISTGLKPRRTLGAAAILVVAPLLYVLEDKYSHLQHELLLMVGGAILSMMASTVWTLNASRAWIGGSWLYIPLTLGTQLMLIPFTDFSRVSGVLTFNLCSVFPSLALNLGLSYRGFRRPLPAG